MTEDELTRAVTIDGVEIQVVSDAEMLRARAVKPIQVGTRVAEGKADPATFSADHARRREQLPCERCEQLCWFDPMAGPGRMFVRLLCVECLCLEAQS